MLLYHGTTSHCLDRILKEGLRPRKHTKISNWKVKSGSDRIYLSNAYAPYFAMNAINENRGDLPMVLEIDTRSFNIMNMVADEDYLEQITRRHDNLPSHWSMHQRTVYYRQRAQQMGFELDAGSAFDSLKYLGNCAYVDTIPPEAITCIVTWDTAKAWELSMMFMDPTITLQNYAFVGKKYRWMLALLMGHTPDPKDAPIMIPEMCNVPAHYEYPYELTDIHKAAINTIRGF